MIPVHVAVVRNIRNAVGQTSDRVKELVRDGKYKCREALQISL